MRESIEKRLASGNGTIGGIELHREIEAGVPGQSIPTLIIVLDMTREDFSDLLGRGAENSERPGPARTPVTRGQRLAISDRACNCACSQRL
jgi:hypothetical protein